ncbi:hypothetical protein [Williamsia sp. D3]|uniref:hypothetical protein n=1 Tax=Williamsia sp. D3 TaxID=1313067 RepID=UPI0003D355DA|nr:hypothetical protein [Williamsia sp. D3]ETD31518.1 hypothetical protein W823_19205 [Williamsia sp. D3]
MADLCSRFAEPTERTGPGRWVIVRGLCHGTLWTNERTIGFQVVPTPGADPLPVLDAITATPGTTSEAFDQLAAIYGESAIVAGNLDNWRPDKVSKR